MSPYAGCFFRFNDNFNGFPVLDLLQERLLRLQSFPTIFKPGCVIRTIDGVEAFIGTYPKVSEFLGRPVAVIRNYIRDGMMLNGTYLGEAIYKQGKYILTQDTTVAAEPLKTAA